MNADMFSASNCCRTNRRYYPLPLDIRLSPTLPTFKRRLKTHPFIQQFTLHSCHPVHVTTAFASDSAFVLTLCTIEMLVLLLPIWSQMGCKGKGKSKSNIDLYSAFMRMPLTRSDMDHTVLPANNTIFAFTRKHSPGGATTHKHIANA